MSESRSFCSKLLLFGEYSVIRDSQALATPYPLFEGRLNFKRSGEKAIEPELRAFCSYLKKQIREDKLNFSFDISSFDFDISQGLHFDSSIPQGFGVGSSGALCAALFDRYAASEHKSGDILELKKYFSQMESHFHGSSSGVDPLISYLNGPLLIREKTNLGIVSFPQYNQGEGGLFLLNTGRPRRTEPLVNLFLEKSKDSSFSQLCEEVLLPITNSCIENFLEGKIEKLYEYFRQLSDFQYRHFRPMIPHLYEDIWRQGLKSEHFYLKLCGAGGGGFLLGMTKNFKSAVKELCDHEIRPLYRF